MEEAQLTLFGKTCPERSAVKKERTSVSSSRNSQKLKQVIPLFLDLQKESGQMPEPSWVMGGALLGGSSTRNFTASPNVAVESYLSQILQADVPEKYYLSALACRGILRRAERRGKELPEMLRVALSQMIEREESA